MQYIFLLGRQPELSSVELVTVLESLGLAHKIVEISPLFLVIEVEEELPADLMDRLGGTDRIAQVVAQQKGEWSAQEIVELFSPIDKKIWLGVSLVQRSESDLYDAKKLKSLVHDIKTKLHAKGVKMKFVIPSSGLRLNAAQVMFNKLDTPKNYEIILVEGAEGWYAARTLQIQDIQAYEKRDTGKPSRDARVGMLPPKLAQIMINVATARVLPAPVSILDPFCGSGTVLQEGWLMDYHMIGMDKDPAMVAAAKKNLAGLSRHFRLNPKLQPEVTVHDATTPFPREFEGKIDAVVAEPYLGKPLRAALSPTEIEQAQNELAKMYRAFFQQALPVLKPQGIVLFLLPAFQQKSTSDWALFPQAFLDDIRGLGYVKCQLVPPVLQPYFEGDERKDLVYARPDALVGRELTLWQKT